MTFHAPMIAALAVVGCMRQAPAADTNPRIIDMRLESPAFQDGKPIPIEHTCEGDDISPELRWSGVPEGARSLALIVDDPDAPDPKAPQRTWVHWVLYDMPSNAERLPEDGEPRPVGTRDGRNDWGRTGYGGPCPPIGEHRYFFKLYALDVELGDLAEPSKAELEHAMMGHVMAEAELVGTYKKTK
jgi:Raf kinase inhibitor-like YbhB/YbcL family protein